MKSCMLKAVECISDCVVFVQQAPTIRHSLTTAYQTVGFYAIIVMTVCLFVSLFVVNLFVVYTLSIEPIDV